MLKARLASGYQGYRRFNSIKLGKNTNYIFETSSILNTGTQLYGPITNGIFDIRGCLVWVINNKVERVESKIVYRLFREGMREVVLHYAKRDSRQFSVALDGRYECFDTGSKFLLADGFIILEREIK